MRVSKLFFMFILVAMSILFIQCEKKPVDQIEIAQTILKKMDAEQASHYAPEKYEMAMNSYNQAQTFLNKKDYKKAATQLEYFINLANAAISKAQNEKENEKYKQKEADIVYSDNQSDETDVAPLKIEENASPIISGSQIHVVESGECLSGISKKYYNKSKFWKNIYEANSAKIKDPGLIYPGQELTIPEIQTEAVLKDNEYQVQEGENLWKIAEKFYPNSDNNRWHLIYKENKEVIYNPNILKSGLIIVIPDLTKFNYTSGDSLYLVKKGDSFWSIAEMMNKIDSTKNVTWQQIYYLNMTDLSDSNSIYPDQLIKLP